MYIHTVSSQSCLPLLALNLHKLKISQWMKRKTFAFQAAVDAHQHFLLQKGKFGGEPLCNVLDAFNWDIIVTQLVKYSWVPMYSLRTLKPSDFVVVSEQNQTCGPYWSRLAGSWAGPTQWAQLYSHHHVVRTTQADSITAVNSGTKTFIEKIIVLIAPGLLYLSFDSSLPSWLQMCWGHKAKW